MMKFLSTWKLPVAVSLILHIGLLVLVTHKFTAINPAANQSQPFTVELSNANSAPSSKSRPQAVPKKIIEKPAPDDDRSKVAIALNPATETAQTVPAKAVEVMTDNQPADTAAESQPARTGIQPLSKLTRLPSFLQKIEPVYPRSEQRAGSQAYVLAEVTIDEKGNVQNVRIAKSAGATFDNAVIDALKKSVFVPGYIGQEAVAVRVLVPIRFNLK